MDSKLISHLQSILKELRNSPSAWPFLSPVDWKGMGLTEYPKIVKEPMDLKTVGKKLKSKAYRTPTPFWNDLDLIWNNCKMFNTESAEVFHLAVDMKMLTASLRTAFEIDNPPSETATLLSAKGGGSSSQQSEVSSEEVPIAPEAVNQLADRFSRLEPSDAAVVVRYVAQEAPSCLSPLIAKQEGSGRDFELDLGTLLSEYPVIFKRTHGLIKILLLHHQKTTTTR